MRKQGCQSIASGLKWHRYIWSFVPSAALFPLIVPELSASLPGARRARA